MGFETSARAFPLKERENNEQTRSSMPIGAPGASDRQDRVNRRVCAHKNGSHRKQFLLPDEFLRFEMVNSNKVGPWKIQR